MVSSSLISSLFPSLFSLLLILFSPYQCHEYYHYHFVIIIIIIIIIIILSLLLLLSLLVYRHHCYHNWLWIFNATAYTVLHDFLLCIVTHPHNLLVCVRNISHPFPESTLNRSIFVAGIANHVIITQRLILTATRCGVLTSTGARQTWDRYDICAANRGPGHKLTPS